MNSDKANRKKVPVWLIFTVLFLVISSYYAVNRAFEHIRNEVALAVRDDYNYHSALWGKKDDYEPSLYPPDDKPEYFDKNYDYFLFLFKAWNYHLQNNGEYTYSIEEMLSDGNIVGEYIVWVRYDGYNRGAIRYYAKTHAIETEPFELTEQQKETLKSTLYSMIDARYEEACKNIRLALIKIIVSWIGLNAAIIALYVYRRKYYE